MSSAYRTTDVPRGITRELYDCLAAARLPIQVASGAMLLVGDGERASRYAELVERIDAALADAYDYLPGGH